MNVKHVAWQNNNKVKNEKLCYPVNNLNTATLPVLCHGKIPQHFCQDHLRKRAINCYKPLK